MSIAILEAYGIDVEKDIEASYYSIAEGLENWPTALSTPPSS